MILITTNNYFGITTNFAYGQTNQTIFNNANPLNIKNIPIKKVHLGDIDLAYKTFGKGQPFLLISGAGGNMDAWEPSTLKNLSTNHTLQAVPEAKDLFGGIPPNTIKQQYGIVHAWTSTNRSGVCDKLASVSSPTLIISGTDDNSVLSDNSLIIAAKIPGAWLVHTKDAAHQRFMSQYPDKFNKVLQTFPSTKTNSG